MMKMLTMTIHLSIYLFIYSLFKCQGKLSFGFGIIYYGFGSIHYWNFCYIQSCDFWITGKVITAYVSDLAYYIWIFDINQMILSPSTMYVHKRRYFPSKLIFPQSMFSFGYLDRFVHIFLEIILRCNFNSRKYLVLQIVSIVIR